MIKISHLYRITAVLKVETELYLSKFKRMSCDTGDNVYQDF